LEQIDNAGAPRERGALRWRGRLDRRTGYREILLDMLPSMTGAQSLYRSLGFFPIEPCYETPISGTIFMALTLPGDRD
jgi:hypothetical protein